MKVVIVGSITRSEFDDFGLVNLLIDELKKMYSDLFVITTACDRGIGKIVNNRLRKGRAEHEEPEVPFLDINYRIYGKDLPKAVYALLYITRNAALIEAGEEFHIFLDREKRGAMPDLLDKVREAGLKYSVYYPGEQCGPKLLK